MKITFFAASLLLVASTALPCEEITPHKFTDHERRQGMPCYTIPESSRFTTQRLDTNAPNIVYYLSKPKVDTFPIAILCGGSSSKDDILSIIHFHRYLLKEFLDLGVAVLTVEQRGVDGNNINVAEFIEYYTRTNRLNDHKLVIEHLKLNPPQGWNGKFIFLGASEGGPLVTTLTSQYHYITIATINLCGAGDWSWREELYVFLQNLCASECPEHHQKRCSTCLPEEFYNRFLYDTAMDNALQDPSPEKYFAGMTHLYHADALTWPPDDYEKIRTPFLVVAGTNDSIIQSCDEFVLKAKKAGAPITYERVEGMDHYVKNRPDVMERSFEWLSKQIYVSAL